MALHREPPRRDAPREPDTDPDEAGWDPDVAALIVAAAGSATASAEDDEDQPVMTISRRVAPPGSRKKDQ
jgi:hypothetical protein